MRSDLVPLAQAALMVFRNLCGTVVFDPSAFWSRVGMPFGCEDIGLRRYWIPNIVVDDANWLGFFASYHVPGPQRELAAQSLCDIFDLIPPLEPLNERIAACRKVVTTLLEEPHRDEFVRSGYRDVFALVERIAEEVDSHLLSDICSPVTRMVRPISVIDELESWAHENGDPLPPGAVQIAAAALQLRARESEEPLQVPENLSAALGAVRARGISAPVDIGELSEMAQGWTSTYAAIQDEHHLVRRWLSAAFELIVRVQLNDVADEIWFPFELDDLNDLYVNTPIVEEVDVESDGEADAGSADLEEATDGAPTDSVLADGSVSSDVDQILQELDSIIGQPQLKRQIRKLVTQVRLNKQREAHGLKSSQLASHMAFTGPPGTGKTTVARIIGRLFHALGVLPSDSFEEIDRSGLVAEHIGGTETKTREAIERAMGGVLFIDEAYSLAQGGSNDYGSQAVSTILKALTDERGRFVCIVAGYTDKMDEFLDSNQGMRSRFTTNITFQPYSAAELVDIAASMATADDNILDDGARDELLKRLQSEERMGGFDADDWGNARTVANLLEAAAAHRDMRLIDEGMHDRVALMTITAADISLACDDQQIASFAEDHTSVETVLAELDQQIGQEQLKRQVATMIAGVRAQQAREAQGLGTSGALIEHLVFTGPPGTGKTTIARLIAKLYKSLGLLPGGQVIEVDRGGLVAGFVGQTALKTNEKIDEAMGGVLLIDEAYALASSTGGTGHDFGREAIEALLKRMEDDRGKFLVIAAGYPDEMSGFLTSNPGLPSRFTQTIAFDSYGAHELALIAASMAAAAHSVITPEAQEVLEQRLVAAEERGLMTSREWGNAREIRNLLDEASRCRDVRIFAVPNASPTLEELTTVTVADIVEACEKRGL